MVIELGPEAASAGARIGSRSQRGRFLQLEESSGGDGGSQEEPWRRYWRLCLFQTHGAKWPGGLQRYGNDVVVIWDAEDTGSDVFLDAGLLVARALCARPKSISEEVDADFEALEKAILEIGRQADGLDEITKSSETIRSSNDKIINRARIMRGWSEQANQHLERKGDGLRELIGNLA